MSGTKMILSPKPNFPGEDNHKYLVRNERTFKSRVRGLLQDIHEKYPKPVIISWINDAIGELSGLVVRHFACLDRKPGWNKCASFVSHDQN
jgi:hypothetical protein